MTREKKNRWLQNNARVFSTIGACDIKYSSRPYLLSKAPAILLLKSKHAGIHQGMLIKYNKQVSPFIGSREFVKGMSRLSCCGPCFLAVVAVSSEWCKPIEVLHLPIRDFLDSVDNSVIFFTTVYGSCQAFHTFKDTPLFTFCSPCRNVLSRDH